MNVMGIVLLIVGALAFLASFVVSDRDQDGKKYSKAMGLKLDRMIDERVDELKVRLSDVAGAAREEEEMRAQRELERITNEKIMAIDDYSRAVLEEIEKNHKEVMFLYDMLESKTSDVKNTIRKADAVKREQESVIEESAAPASPVAASAYAPEPEPETEKKISGMDKLRSAFAETDIEPSAEDIADAIRDEMGGLDPDEPELSRNDRVLEMKKNGMDNVDIAKALNIGVGEVNLITDLFSGDDGNGGEG
ncbi:MAG: hypothetical protein K6A90_09470 [Lachnospiraceae bacterium]|nr:hypothetical protein [Lachnospiraceae bacterium]